MKQQVIDHFLSYEQFLDIDEVKKLQLNDDELIIIYTLLDHNRFVLSNSHYMPVLIHTINKKTSQETGLKAKSLLMNDYKIFLNV